MKQLIEYFDRAYILNLADRVDRRNATTREFREIGLSIPNEKVQFYTSVRPTDKGTFTSIGNRGCSNGHRSILELALADRLRNVLIFEDDIGFKRIDLTLERKIISQLDHKEWDVVFFANLLAENVPGNGQLIHYKEDILGAHFYAVNGRFIGTMVQYLYDCEKRPLGHPEGGPMPPDGAYNHIRYVNPNVRLFVAPQI